MSLDRVRGFIAQEIERQKAQQSAQPAPNNSASIQPAAQATNSSPVMSAAMNFANVFQQGAGYQIVGTPKQGLSIQQLASLGGGGFLGAVKGAAIQKKQNDFDSEKQSGDSSFLSRRPVAAPESLATDRQTNGLVRRFMPNPSLRMTK